MRNKRFLSTVVAAALVASTMAVPVMAADGGEVDVDVTTKNAVIRVEVPTSLEVAVNQFEKQDTGSQIYSTTFGIKNKSEIPVKVDVQSTATLGNGINLVSSKSAAESSTADEAWMAVAAQTSAGKYIEEAGKDVKDLTESNDNVTTFVQDSTTTTSATAGQVFYLGVASTPSVTYTKVAPTDADELAAAKEISYAQFYELTAIATQPTDDDTLQAEVNKADVYAIDGSDTVTLIAKGTSNATFATGSTYYTAGSQLKAADLTTGKIYVYGETGDGGAAGFRYLGKLSEARETWTSTDINKVKIAYTITGVTATKYDEVDDNCTYGLYKEPAPTDVAPSIATTSYAMTAGTAIDIIVDLGLGESSATAVSRIMDPTGAFDYLGGDYATYDVANKKITLKASMIDACIAGNVSSIDVIFNDNNNTSVTVALTK